MLAAEHPGTATAIEASLARREDEERRRLDPVSERLTANVVGRLLSATHFVGPVREDFTDLLRISLRFLRYRYDIEPSRAGEALAYLFGPADGPHPHEDALAIDFHQTLVMYAVAGRARYELRGIGSGRVDVVVDHSTHEFSAEVKRELVDSSRDSIARYLRQASQYSGSGVRLGMLLVLDLVPRPQGVEAIEALAYVEEVPGATPDDVPRHIVVIKVPAARGSPSSLSRRRRRRRDADKL